MGKLITAPEQLANFFDQLDKVAPSDIEPDVGTLQKAFQKESDSLAQDLTDPMAGIVSGLATGLSSVSAYEAVDKWTVDQCGPPPGTKWTNGQ
ncbi:MAG TPA: hypothetical protein VMW80_11470 [Candidatus Dormibacteraeota bacterium]|nr:hypothetical protein [Candidatus Dormibacteraeota bacterium]